MIFQQKVILIKHKDVDWNEYKNDYLLRTDAVWEK